MSVVHHLRIVTSHNSDEVIVTWEDRFCLAEDLDESNVVFVGPAVLADDVTSAILGRLFGELAGEGPEVNAG